MFKPYLTYEEIPTLTREYIQTVANVKEVIEIPLSDINSFLHDLTEYNGAWPNETTVSQETSL